MLLLPYLMMLPTLWIIRYMLREAICESHIPMERLVGWMAFLPLHLALSGQIQAHGNHLTCQTARHLMVGSWKEWLLSEVFTAIVLGVGLAFMFGLLAMIFANDVTLALAIGLAQLATCVVAGLVGPWIPFAAAYTKELIAQQDDLYAWMIPLGAAMQDLLGTVVWFLVSQYFLLHNDADPEEELVILDDRTVTFCG